MERDKYFSLSKGVGGKPLENKQGSGRCLECGRGGLGQPACGLPFEKLEGASHFFLEEANFFTSAFASSIGF